MSHKRDFSEIERMPGWKHYVLRIENAIKNLQTDLQTIEFEGKTADQIGVEVIQISSRIEGLRRAMGVVEDIKNAQEIDDD